MFVQKGLQRTTKQQSSELIKKSLDRSFSSKNNKPIDWENALSLLLLLVPLCLSTSNGKP